MDLSFLSKNEKILVKLLSSSISGEDYNLDCSEDVAWDKIFEMACRHQVMTLIYPLLNNISCSLAVPQTLQKKWQCSAMIEALGQERSFNVFVSVLNKLSLAGIPVILLKGLVLRDLYPYPILRTMSDFDILIKPDDMKCVHEILLECGFKDESCDGIHTVYVNRESLVIELHKKLIPENYFNNSMSFESNIWMMARPKDFYGCKVQILGYDDEFIYIILHMATHIKSSGFGLRQLCDLVLIYKCYNPKLNIEKLLEMAGSLKIETFLKTIMSLCSVLFSVDISKDLQLSSSKENEELIMNMIKYIIHGGVYGDQSIERFTVNRMIYYSGGEKSNRVNSKAKFIREFLLPSINRLDNRYEYARKYHILLPVAWLHRLLVSLFRKDLRLNEKFRVLRLMSSSHEYAAHSNLLRELDLLD